MTRLLYTSFDDRLDNHQVEFYLSLLPEQITERLRKFRHWQDFQRGLLGKVLLIKGLEIFGIGDRDLRTLQYNVFNRPFISGNLDFNISHSGKWIVCVMSDTCRVGVDVEEINPEISVEDFRMAFSDEEISAIRGDDVPMQFFDLWTRKEAVIKADGRGMNIHLKNVSVFDHFATVENKTWYLHKIELDQNYSVHIALDQECITPALIEIDLNTN